MAQHDTVASTVHSVQVAVIVAQESPDFRIASFFHLESFLLTMSKEALETAMNSLLPLCTTGLEEAPNSNLWVLKNARSFQPSFDTVDGKNFALEKAMSTVLGQKKTETGQKKGNGTK